MLKTASKFNFVTILFFVLTTLLVACGGETPNTNNPGLPVPTVGGVAQQAGSDLVGKVASTQAAPSTAATTSNPAGNTTAATVAGTTEAAAQPTTAPVAPTTAPPAPTATATPKATTAPKPRLPIPGVAIANNMKQQLEQLATQAEELRGLTFQRKVENFFITRSNLATYYRQSSQQSSAEEQAESKKAIRVLQAFGLLPKQLDEKLTDPGQSANNVAGFYTTDTKKFYLVVDSLANRLTPYDKLTAVHELTHALQDQAFDIQRLRLNAQAGQDEWNDDRDLAITSAIEGDAMHTEDLWFKISNLTNEDINTLINDSKKAAAEPPPASNNTSKPPLILVETLYFPYEQGAEFITFLYKNGGLNSVNKAFTEYPPVSTAQILHPEKYQKRTEPINVPLPSIPAVLGNDWKIVSTNVMGELQTRIWLEAGQANRQAYDAATGWAGDRYQVVENGKGDTGYVWRLVFDIETDTDEFARAALNTLTKNHKLGKPDMSAGIYSWTMPELEVSLTLKGREVLITVLPKGAGIEKLVKAVGF